MKKFKLIRSEVVPMLITETVEIEANDLKEAIEDVVEGYGEVIISDQEEVAYAYNIEKHDNTSTLSVYNTDKKYPTNLCRSAMKPEIKSKSTYNPYE